MFPCPSVAPDVTPREFWALMSADPRPRIIPGGATADFAAQFGTPASDGGATFDFAGTIEPSGKRYQLANPGPDPRHQSSVFRQLPQEFPLPLPVRSINLTPMISVGLNGTGQTDLARHYHGITAMLLLQGRKIWALRPPQDPECMANSGDCTDPLDVCQYYRQPGSPPPACVQQAGETIVLPDGWHHGTCNAADTWTIGWGGQNRRLDLQPPTCHHCRAAGPPPRPH